MRILGIGTDITEISRIEQMSEKHKDHFLERVYTETELAYSRTGKQSGEHLAGRWAAKEAVLKAFGTGWTSGITWKDIEVRNEISGKPSIHLSGGAKTIADSLGADNVLISISHSGNTAIAFAILVQEESHEK